MRRRDPSFLFIAGFGIRGVVGPVADGVRGG
jgi:hypothetical protein